MIKWMLSMTHIHYCLPTLTHIWRKGTLHARCPQLKLQTVRQSAVVVRTSSECERGVDLAVRRRIKWLIGGARRVEGVKRSGLPSLPVSLSLPPALSLPQPGEKATGAEQTNHMAIKHYSPLLHWDFIQTAFYWSLQCTHTNIQRHTHSLNTHTYMRKHTHCWVSPSTWQWFYKSPQCEVSYSLSSPRTTSAVRAEEKRERRTIQLLNRCCSALQGKLSIKLIKKVVKVVAVL